MPINARINQKGQEREGRDTAKIAAGTAAGAIIGHQINDGSGQGHRRPTSAVRREPSREEDPATEVEIPAAACCRPTCAEEFVYSGR